ncbi:MAG: hypothetical protein AAF514_23230 [Verrucomicrobiota bacterium]
MTKGFRMLPLLGVIFASACAHHVHEIEQPKSYAGPGQSDSVSIGENWVLSGEVVDVEEAQTDEIVLRASAHNGARLESVGLATQTRVDTVATADQIFYNAVLEKFELIGNPLVQQGGITMLSQPGSYNRAWVRKDGTIRRTTIPSDRMSTSDYSEFSELKDIE